MSNKHADKGSTSARYLQMMQEKKPD